MMIGIREIRNVVVPGGLLVMFCGCEKELDFDYHDIEPIIVIEGSVSEQGANVAITLTTPMEEPMDGTRLTDATVTLTDLTAMSVEKLQAGVDGNFCSAVGGIVGHSYQLTVEHQGTTYTSTSTMLPSTDILAMEFQWIKMPYDDVAMLQVTFADNPVETGECYWVRIYRNGETYMWSVVTDMLAVDGQVDNVLMTSRRDIEEEDEATVLCDGDVVTASVAPISRVMYDYLEAISIGTSNGPQMFDGGSCLGYFLAAPVVSSTVVFHPDEIEEYR